MLIILFILLYPAQIISTRKAQTVVAKKIDPEVLAKYRCKLVFLGRFEENFSDSSLFTTLDSRKIPYEYLGFITNRSELIDLYVRARGVLMTSAEDSAPRVIFEGAFGNTPFLISPQVELSPSLDHLGVRLKSPELDDLNEGIEKLLSTDWGNLPLDFARNHFNDTQAYKPMFDTFDSLFCAKYPHKCSVIS
eukprot:TRINITY_DN17596_c0_g1_i1.p1 TRINITY_DN17596_c0_g1~~TRINITY_DN17596_c0_g1_i1.p1  ORF type:complete len:192 (-),score=30.86 TRINITY_DN17596_c0_g1_i1:119-694(-)